MAILIGIHNTPGSFSDRWITYCEENNIAFKIVDCLASDVIRQCDELNAVLWHWPHYGLREQLIARAVIASLEQKRIKVFPSTATCWHYDDKVAQKFLLEAIGSPLIPTWVFTDKSEARAWVGHATWPKVFKLRGGAGSSNVRLVNSCAQAENICRRAFGKGFPAVAGYFNDMPTRLRKTKSWKQFRERLVRLPSNFMNIIRSRLYEFLPNNRFDTRITVIGNRAFGFIRMNRQNDFRASGSGEIQYNTDNIDRRCLMIAFGVSQRLGTQSLAFDFIFDQHNEPMIGEVSYCFMAEAVHACPGHWDSALNWHEGHLWPQEAILDDMLASYALQR